MSPWTGLARAAEAGQREARGGDRAGPLTRRTAWGQTAGSQLDGGDGGGLGLRAPKVVVRGGPGSFGQRKGAHGRCAAWAYGPERLEIACGTVWRGPEGLVARGLLCLSAMW
ncbi:hypothetical protein NDU88_000622 [Pleurodeles waltl]|uniref:Uncharacterized protein n=1 Tax=Pleurodeles waltl TaxID=8319 RepID=A0AAV7VY28_PLEWA|nr:hypothetical protein NDU88_000622 [Pleurodeles waltl]